RFRRDLYFRLVGVRVEMPALRSRLDDLPALVENRLSAIASEPRMDRKRISREALGVLASHPWPGNVRELEQVLRRAVLVAETELIQPEDLALDRSTRLERRGAHEQLDREL